MRVSVIIGLILLLTGCKVKCGGPWWERDIGRHHNKTEKKAVKSSKGRRGGKFGNRKCPKF